MFQIQLTRTIPLYPHGVFVQWELINPPDSGVYVFSVYRSGGPEGPWTLLGETAEYHFEDTVPTTQPPTVQAPTLLSGSPHFYYRVVARAPLGATAEAISEIDPFLEPRQKAVRRKILRDAAVMLRKLNGVEVAVLKKKHWGERCPKCYDKYTKEATRGNCTTCYGTTYTGGYYKPVITYAKRSTAPEQDTLTSQGKVAVVRVALTMLDLPKIDHDDIIVFLRENQRYIVNQIHPTELKTVTVHQRLVATQIAPGAVEYKIKVDPTNTPPLF